MLRTTLFFVNRYFHDLEGPHMDHFESLDAAAGPHEPKLTESRQNLDRSLHIQRIAVDIGDLVLFILSAPTLTYLWPRISRDPIAEC